MSKSINVNNNDNNDSFITVSYKRNKQYSANVGTSTRKDTNFSIEKLKSISNNTSTYISPIKKNKCECQDDRHDFLCRYHIYSPNALNSVLKSFQKISSNESFNNLIKTNQGCNDFIWLVNNMNNYTKNKIMTDYNDSDMADNSSVSLTQVTFMINNVNFKSAFNSIDFNDFTDALYRRNELINSFNKKSNINFDSVFIELQNKEYNEKMSYFNNKYKYLLLTTLDNDTLYPESYYIKSKCSICNMYGHSFKFCNTPFKCVKCHTFGHLKNNCPIGAIYCELYNGLTFKSLQFKDINNTDYIKFFIVGSTGFDNKLLENDFNLYKSLCKQQNDLKYFKLNSSIIYCHEISNINEQMNNIIIHKDNKLIIKHMSDIYLCSDISLLYNTLLSKFNINCGIKTYAAALSAPRVVESDIMKQTNNKLTMRGGMIQQSNIDIVFEKIKKYNDNKDIFDKILSNDYSFNPDIQLIDNQRYNELRNEIDNGNMIHLDEYNTLLETSKTEYENKILSYKYDIETCASIIFVDLTVYLNTIINNKDTDNTLFLYLLLNYSELSFNDISNITNNTEILNKFIAVCKHIYTTLLLIYSKDKAGCNTGRKEFMNIYIFFQNMWNKKAIEHKYTDTLIEVFNSINIILLDNNCLHPVFGLLKKVSKSQSSNILLDSDFVAQYSVFNEYINNTKKYYYDGGDIDKNYSYEFNAYDLMDKYTTNVPFFINNINKILSSNVNSVYEIIQRFFAIAITKKLSNRKINFNKLSKYHYLRLIFEYMCNVRDDKNNDFKTFINKCIGSDTIMIWKFLPSDINNKYHLKNCLPPIYFRCSRKLDEKDPYFGNKFMNNLRTIIERMPLVKNDNNSVPSDFLRISSPIEADLIIAYLTIPGFNIRQYSGKSYITRLAYTYATHYNFIIEKDNQNEKYKHIIAVFVIARIIMFGLCNRINTPINKNTLKMGDFKLIPTTSIVKRIMPLIIETKVISNNSIENLTLSQKIMLYTRIILKLNCILKSTTTYQKQYFVWKYFNKSYMVNNNQNEIVINTYINAFNNNITSNTSNKSNTNIKKLTIIKNNDLYNYNKYSFEYYMVQLFESRASFTFIDYLQYNFNQVYERDVKPKFILFLQQLYINKYTLFIINRINDIFNGGSSIMYYASRLFLFNQFKRFININYNVKSLMKRGLYNNLLNAFNTCYDKKRFDKKYINYSKNIIKNICLKREYVVNTTSRAFKLKEKLLKYVYLNQINKQYINYSAHIVKSTILNATKHMIFKQYFNKYDKNGCIKQSKYIVADSWESDDYMPSANNDIYISNYMGRVKYVSDNCDKWINNNETTKQLLLNSGEIKESNALTIINMTRDLIVSNIQNNNIKFSDLLGLTHIATQYTNLFKMIIGITSNDINEINIYINEYFISFKGLNIKLSHVKDIFNALHNNGHLIYSSFWMYLHSIIGFLQKRTIYRVNVFKKAIRYYKNIRKNNIKYCNDNGLNIHEYITFSNRKEY